MLNICAPLTKFNKNEATKKNNVAKLTLSQRAIKRIRQEAAVKSQGDRPGKPEKNTHNIRLVLVNMLPRVQAQLAETFLDWTKPRIDFYDHRAKRTLAQMVPALNGKSEESQKQSIKKAVNALERKGIISVIRRGHLRKTNEYQLNIEALQQVIIDHFPRIRRNKKEPLKSQKGPPTKILSYLDPRECVSHLPSNARAREGEIKNRVDYSSEIIEAMNYAALKWGIKLGPRDFEIFERTLRASGNLETPEMAQETFLGMRRCVDITEVNKGLKNPQYAHSIGRLHSWEKIIYKDQALKKRMKMSAVFEVDLDQDYVVNGETWKGSEVIDWLGIQKEFKEFKEFQEIEKIEHEHSLVAQVAQAAPEEQAAQVAQVESPVQDIPKTPEPHRGPTFEDLEECYGQPWEGILFKKGCEPTKAKIHAFYLKAFEEGVSREEIRYTAEIIRNDLVLRNEETEALNRFLRLDDTIAEAKKNPKELLERVSKFARSDAEKITWAALTCHCTEDEAKEYLRDFLPDHNQVQHKNIPLNPSHSSDRTSPLEVPYGGRVDFRRQEKDPTLRFWESSAL